MAMKHMQTPRLLAMSATSAMIAATSAGTAAPVGTTQPGTVLRIGTFLSAIDYAPFYVAKNGGCLAALARRYRKTIDYRIFTTVQGMNDAVNAGTLDIVLEADTPAILQRAAGTDIREITPLAALSQQMLVPATSPVRGMSDLRGKRIGVLYGSGYHFALADGMAAAGVRPDEFTTIDVAPMSGGPLLAQGAIDAWAIWPPILQQTVAKASVRAIAGSASTMNVYAFAAGPYLHRNAPLTTAFATCMRRAIRTIRARPAEAIAVTAVETGIAGAIVAAAWPTMTFGFRVDDEILRVLDAQAAFLFQQGVVARRVRFDRAMFRDRGRRE